jgi:hypothetical protein
MGEIIKCVKTAIAQASEEFVAVPTLGGRMWEHTVLVTDVDYELSAIGQLCRDQCDCENGFDELKKPVGLGRLHYPRYAPQ